MRALFGVLGFQLWAGGVSADEIQAVINNPVLIESMAQEIAMKMAGAIACKIEKTLPDADMKVILTALAKARPEAVQAGVMKAALVVKGFVSP